jgi:hypothetical protein
MGLIIVRLCLTRNPGALNAEFWMNRVLTLDMSAIASCVTSVVVTTASGARVTSDSPLWDCAKWLFRHENLSREAATEAEAVRIANARSNLTNENWKKVYKVASKNRHPLAKPSCTIGCGASTRLYRVGRGVFFCRLHRVETSIWDTWRPRDTANKPERRVRGRRLASKRTR